MSFVYGRIESVVDVLQEGFEGRIEGAREYLFSVVCGSWYGGRCGVVDPELCDGSVEGGEQGNTEQFSPDADATWDPRGSDERGHAAGIGW